MIEKIFIENDVGNLTIKEGNVLSVNNGSFKTRGNTVEVELEFGGTIIIPPDNYKLLSIGIDCGDLKINLPGCFFEKIEIEADCGNIDLNTNYNDIEVDHDCGNFINKSNNNNFNKIKKTNSQLKKAPQTVSRKTKTILDDLDEEKIKHRVDGERYEW